MKLSKVVLGTVGLAMSIGAVFASKSHSAKSTGETIYTANSPNVLCYTVPIEGAAICHKLFANATYYTTDSTTKWKAGHRFTVYTLHGE